MITTALLDLIIVWPSLSSLLEFFFGKYRIIKLGENYIDSEKVLYLNRDNAKFKKNINIIHDGDHFNVIDSIRRFVVNITFAKQMLIYLVTDEIITLVPY